MALNTTEAPVYSAGGALVFGRHGNLDQDNFNFKGVIDEVRIWNSVRNSADIAANYQKDVLSTTAGLTGYWKFNENSGTLAADSTINKRTATLSNGATWTPGAPRQ